MLSKTVLCVMGSARHRWKLALVPTVQKNGPFSTEVRATRGEGDRRRLAVRLDRRRGHAQFESQSLITTYMQRAKIQ